MESNFEPRFVVLHHTGWLGHPDHYDLMLQFSPGANDDDTVLKTWSTVMNLFPNAVVNSEFLQVFDHRRLYLHYEGPISNDRGIVSRVDEGKLWLPEKCDDDNVQDFPFRLYGKMLIGTFRLRRIGQKTYRFQKE